MNDSSVATQLAELLQQENAALVRLDLHAASALLDAKTALSTALAEMPASAVSAEDMQRLQILASENRQLLQRAILVQQRVIGLVRGAVLATREGVHYGAAGQPAPRSLGPCAVSRQV